MVDEGRSDEVEPGRDRPSPGPAGESRAPDPGQDPEAPEPGGDPEGLDPGGDPENPEHGTPEDLSRSDTVLETRELTVRYGRNVAIDEVSLEVPEQRITAIIGPSGCGKSTLLRAFNRMNDFVPEASTEGRILFRGEEIHGPGVDPVELRRRIGMVFQKPNPFPKTIYENVAWGPRIHGHEGDLDELVEESLRAAALWDEVKDKLGDVGLALSGGQQQRLCIARAIAMEPEVVLMDEPASALDPVSTSKIEDLLFHLKEDYTIVIVTHNMQQAARVSDFTAFLYEGRLIEFGSTDRIFTRPREQRTEDYITGKFG